MGSQFELSTGFENSGIADVLNMNCQRQMRKWQAIGGLTLLALIISATGCDEDLSRGHKTAKIQTVHGLVREVKSSSLLEFEAMIVEDANGKEWSVENRGTTPPGFTPSHLREHMVLGLPLLVTFHQENDVWILDEISD